jgi:hypothetical protein
MATWFWIVIVIVVVLIALAAAMAARRRRTMALRERFGPEYDRTVGAREGQRAAEAELRDRERQRARLDIKPLSEADRVRYTEEWRVIQQDFVDQPEEATTAGYDLVNRVMAERGYPMQDFDARADLVSVDHPDVVDNYRVAHRIHERARQHEASTEDLREALLRYRSLFEDLLRPDGHAAVPDRQHAAVPDGQAVPEPRQPVSDPALSDRPVTDRPVTDRPVTDGPVSGRPARSQQATEVEAGNDEY